jgi:hypothetical protein
MSQAHEWIDLLRKRTRTEGIVPHSDAFMLDILSKAQRMVNARKQYVLVEEAFSTSPYQIVYDLRTTFPNAVDIVRIEKSEVRLIHLENWRQLWLMSSGWFRQTGTTARIWSKVGRTHFMIWPGVATAYSVNVLYSKLCNKLEEDVTALEVPDDEMHEVLRVAEMVMSVRSGNYAALKYIGVAGDSRESEGKKE